MKKIAAINEFEQSQSPNQTITTDSMRRMPNDTIDE